MKKRKALTALVLALALFGAFTLVSNAASTLQEINAYLNSGITFKLDGEEQILKDATGARTYPITYKGTTYIPIRAVANLLGINVNWDGPTQTILMGKQPSGVDLIDTYTNYYRDTAFANWVEQIKSGDKDPMDISGINCSRWLHFCEREYNGGEKTTADISFNLAGKHDTLTFSYYAEKDVTLKVLGDNGSVLFERDVPGGQVAQTVTVPLFKTTQLTLQITNVPYELRADAYVFNAYLDAN